jgi:hypothetical protein
MDAMPSTYERQLDRIYQSAVVNQIKVLSPTACKPASVLDPLGLHFRQLSVNSLAHSALDIIFPVRCYGHRWAHHFRRAALLCHETGCSPAKYLSAAVNCLLHFEPVQRQHSRLEFLRCKADKETVRGPRVNLTGANASEP